MLSTSILSFSNQLLEENKQYTNSSNSDLSLNSSVTYIKTRYLGSLFCTTKSSIQEKGLSIIRHQVLSLYADAQKKYFTNPHLFFKEKGFPHVLEICDYGIVIGEKDPTARTTLGINGSSNLKKEEKIVVTKVITPLSNIVLWAALKFHSKMIKQKGKKFLGAAFIPLSCSSAIFKQSSFTRLTMKEKFLVNLPHPPLFLCVLRKVSSPRISECHLFACNSIEDVVFLSTQMLTIQQDFFKIGSLSLPLLGDMGSYSFSSFPCHGSRSSPVLYSPKSYLNEYNLNERRCITNFRSKSPSLTKRITKESRKFKDSQFSSVDWNSDQCSSDLYKIETPSCSFYNDSLLYSKICSKKEFGVVKSRTNIKPFFFHEMVKKPISVRFRSSANRFDQIDSRIFKNENPSFGSDQETHISKFFEDEPRRSVFHSNQSSYSKGCPLCEKSHVKRSLKCQNFKSGHKKVELKFSTHGKKRINLENELSPNLFYSKINHNIKNSLKEKEMWQITSSPSKSRIEINNYNGYIVKVKHDESDDTSNQKMIISKSIFLSSEDEGLSKNFLKTDYPVTSRITQTKIEKKNSSQINKGIKAYQDVCDFNSNQRLFTSIRDNQTISEYRLPYNYSKMCKWRSKKLKRSKLSLFKQMIRLRSCFRKSLNFKFNLIKKNFNRDSLDQSFKHLSISSPFQLHSSFNQKSLLNRQNVFNSSLYQPQFKSQYLGMDLTQDMLKLSIQGTQEIPEEKITENFKPKLEKKKLNHFDFMSNVDAKSSIRFTNRSQLPKSKHLKVNEMKTLSQINLLEELGYLP